MSLYDDIGGEPAVAAAVERFYEKIMADPVTRPFFEAIDMPAQRRKQRQFFTVLFKGTSEGTDTYMRRAHQKLVDEDGLADKHFDAVATHLQATLEDLKVPDTHITTIMSAAAGLRDAVLCR